jgi:prepilin-type N-terminal cleavage/methylation domain-containing protein
MNVPRFTSVTRGFTLIELLVVISIIAILATMGVAGGNYVMQRARNLEAKQHMASVIIAIKGYKTEYLRMPTADGQPPTEDGEAMDTTDETAAGLFSTLLAVNRQRNPRGQKFWEAPSAKSNGTGYTTEDGLRDPWLQGYQLLIDYSGDGRLENPYAGSGGSESPELVADVIMWSGGADKTIQTSGEGGKSDDVKSWQ